MGDSFLLLEELVLENRRFLVIFEQNPNLVGIFCQFEHVLFGIGIPIVFKRLLECLLVPVAKYFQNISFCLR